MIAHGLQMDRSNVWDLDFDQPVVNLGSHPESDVVLAGEGILPFHAMVVWQAGSFHLTRLSPEARVSLDGIPLREETIALAEGQCVTIGNYVLSFRRNHLPAGMHITVTTLGTKVTPAPGTPEGLDNSISVNVLSQAAEVQVDQSAVYELEVVNAGQIVAEFSVSLQGVPAEWVEIVPLTFNLNEHERATVTITITPPREPSSTAGKHPLRAIISSPNYPGADVAIPLDLLIEPYYEFSLGSLTPRQQNIYWSKRYSTVTLPITNLGNGPADFTVLALDDENGCSFEFHPQDGQRMNRQGTFPVQAGSTLDLPIDITPLKRPVYAKRSKYYQYTTTVSVAEQAVSPQAASGSVNSRPLFGFWHIALSMIAILLGLIIFSPPSIESFTAEPCEPSKMTKTNDGKMSWCLIKKTDDDKISSCLITLEDNDTMLKWKVSPFAPSVRISDNKDQTLGSSWFWQPSFSVSPEQTTTYTLAPENWLPGLPGCNTQKLEIVVVPEVELKPFAFETLDKRRISDVERQEFDIDEGLRVIMEVRPKTENATLTDNNVGTIQASICAQDADGNPISISCIPLLKENAKVEKANSEEGQKKEYRYAVIEIQNYNTSGTRALLFEYSYLEDFIDPVNYTQPNINIRRGELQLSMESCIDFNNKTICTLDTEASNIDFINFELNLSDSGGLGPLPNQMPKPQVSAFEIYISSESIQDESRLPCDIQVDATYKLVCKVSDELELESGKTYKVRYRYDNNEPLPLGERNDYYMKEDSFDLRVGTKSEVAINVSKLEDIKVVQRIMLTGDDGIISINEQNSSALSGGGLILEAKDGKDVFAADDPVRSGNCSINKEGNKVEVTAINIDCYIYFKHVGEYQLVATFMGNSTLNPSASGTYKVTIAKQDQIEFTKYGGSPFLVTGTPLQVQILLKIPQQANVPPQALDGREVHLELNEWGKQNCKIATKETEETSEHVEKMPDSDNYKIEVRSQSSSIDAPTTPIVAFSITSCNQVADPGLRFTLTFKDIDDFSPSQLADVSLATRAPDAGTAVISIKRVDNKNTDILNTDSLSMLHFGQRYKASITSTSEKDINISYEYKVIGGDRESARKKAIAAALANYAVANWAISFDHSGLTAKLGTCPSNSMEIIDAAGQIADDNDFHPDPWTVIWHRDGPYFHVDEHTVARLKSVSECEFYFEDYVPQAPPRPTIEVTVNSGDGWIKVVKNYILTKIQKQSAKVSLPPPDDEFVGIDLPVEVKLSPDAEITRGTVLPFFTIFTREDYSKFLRLLPLGQNTKCPPAPSPGSFDSNYDSSKKTGDTITITFRATQAATNCTYALTYSGNNYFKGISRIILPTLTFKLRPTKTGLAMDPTTHLVMATVTSTATGIPDGKVDFIDTNNSKILCNDVDLIPLNDYATASCSIPSRKYIRAIYDPGDGSYFSASKSSYFIVP